MLGQLAIHLVCMVYIANLAKARRPKLESKISTKQWLKSHAVEAFPIQTMLNMSLAARKWWERRLFEILLNLRRTIAPVWGRCVCRSFGMRRGKWQMLQAIPPHVSKTFKNSSCFWECLTRLAAPNPSSFCVSHAVCQRWFVLPFGRALGLLQTPAGAEQANWGDDGGRDERMELV